MDVGVVQVPESPNLDSLVTTLLCRNLETSQKHAVRILENQDTYWTTDELVSRRGSDGTRRFSLLTLPEYPAA